MTSKDANSQPTEVLYDIEMGLWEAGMSTLTYDEEHDCFRFKDGRFAFSKTKANCSLLEERGCSP